MTHKPIKITSPILLFQTDIFIISAFLKHCNFRKVRIPYTAPHNEVQIQSSEKDVQDHSDAHPHGRTDGPRQKSNYELINRNKFNMNLWSWFVTKTNTHMQMLTYLIPVPISETRFMWSHNQSNLTRWFLERNVSWSDFCFFFHFDQNIIIFKNEKRYSLAREKDVWRKLNCTICETQLLHGRFRLLGLMLCSEFLCLKALGHQSVTPKKKDVHSIYISSDNYLSQGLMELFTKLVT